MKALRLIQAAVCVCVCAWGSWAQTDPGSRTVRVWIRGSQAPLVGTLISQDESSIVLEIQGVRQTIARSDVVALAEEVTVEERYRAMRRNVRDDDSEMRRWIAEWLMREGRYDLAVVELEGILEIDPYYQQAADLLRVARAQLMLRERAHEGVRHEAPPPEPPTDRPAIPTLTPEQINLLRVFEVNLADPPRMRIAPDAVLRFLAAYPDDPLLPRDDEARQALARGPAVAVLAEMFRLRAREFYGQVEVLEDPVPFRLFRDNVHRSWLINFCASDRCHGGAEAGRLRLINRQPRTEATVYTNFLILDRFRLADGKPLIDYSEPSRSPLLHMGLPRDQSAVPHPEVPTGPAGRDAWRPVFRTPDDRRYRQAVEWILSHYQPHPDYPVDYPPEAPNTPQPRE